MIWVAWKMLTGNWVKYLMIIVGVMFASGLIAQQASIFWGILNLTTSQIKDLEGAELWVMDHNVEFIDDIKPLSENDLYRVRGVEGVLWAVKLYKGLARARLENGKYQQMILLGLDDATFVGAPREILFGELADLRKPDAVMIDDAGYHQLWPNEPFRSGKVFEMNDRRAVVVGVCRARRTFQTFPVVYTRYTQATYFAPAERKMMSFVLAQGQPGTPPEKVCQEIERQTGLQARTREQFAWQTMVYFLKNTGIPINFGMTVLLGFIVGTGIAGLTFYLFTIENLKQFAALKAMGVGNLRLMGMILLQAAVVGLVGYSLGVGVAATFGILAKQNTKLAFFMTWQILVGTGVAVMCMVFLSSLLSIRRVLLLEPAVVFQG